MWLRLRRSAFTCVVWQVKLCDLLWQVALRNSATGSHKQIYTTFNLLIITVDSPCNLLACRLKYGFGACLLSSGRFFGISGHLLAQKVAKRQTVIVVWDSKANATKSLSVYWKFWVKISPAKGTKLDTARRGIKALRCRVPIRTDIRALYTYLMDVTQSMTSVIASHSSSSGTIHLYHPLLPGHAPTTHARRWTHAIVKGRFRTAQRLPIKLDWIINVSSISVYFSSFLMKTRLNFKIHF